MKKKLSATVLMILTAAAIIGIGSYAFAGWGMGGGRGMGYGHGPGMMGGVETGSGNSPGMMGGRGMRYGYGPGTADLSATGYGPGMMRGRGFGFMNRLSDEDLKKMEEERNTFFEVTEDIRRNNYQKRLELRSELAKQNPDPEKAAALQKEISDLETAFDQKRLDHMLRAKKINPDMGKGPMGFGPGFGRGANCR